MSQHPMSSDGQPMAARRAQRGASLLFALVTLAAMSLAAVALVRSVDTASLVAGNLGFKQASVAATGQAAEAAVARLVAMRLAAQLDAVQEAEAYRPTAVENLDVRDRSTLVTRVVVDWNDDDCATPYTIGFAGCLPSRPVDIQVGDPLNPLKARYVITRLCGSAGAPTGANYCAKPVNSSLVPGPGKGTLGYTPGPPVVIDPGPYYRIIVRIVGSRNAVSYTETIVHF